MAELSEGGIDAKAIALLGILAGCFAALRIASPGIDGFEPEWFLLILAARVFGRGFGFVLGALALFASALVTGGVGPWLPFQMLAAAWIGFGAGSLPAGPGIRRARHCSPATVPLPRWSTACSRTSGSGPSSARRRPTPSSQVPGSSTNLHRFLLFDLTTSMGFDLTRAATCAVLILVLGRPVLAALRRASRRAVFEPTPEFLG